MTVLIKTLIKIGLLEDELDYHLIRGIEAGRIEGCIS